MQPWRTPFPIWNQSVVLCPVLLLPDLHTGFSRGRSGGLVFSSLSEFSTVIHTVKGFGIVRKAEIDVFLELSCFFNDPADVDNLISGSSAFSKTSLNIWKLTVNVLLKPGLENFEHYFTSVWDECNCVVVWAFFSITGWGIDLDYCDIESFALEKNRDHSVIFETASKLEKVSFHSSPKERQCQRMFKLLHNHVFTV